MVTVSYNILTCPPSRPRGENGERFIAHLAKWNRIRSRAFELVNVPLPCGERDDKHGHHKSH
jgi:hypothetical protein